MSRRIDRASERAIAPPLRRLLLSRQAGLERTKLDVSHKEYESSSTAIYPPIPDHVRSPSPDGHFPMLVCLPSIVSHPEIRKQQSHVGKHAPFGTLPAQKPTQPHGRVVRRGLFFSSLGRRERVKFGFFSVFNSQLVRSPPPPPGTGRPPHRFGRRLADVCCVEISTKFSRHCANSRPVLAERPQPRNTPRKVHVFIMHAPKRVLRPLRAKDQMGHENMHTHTHTPTLNQQKPYNSL